MPPVPRAVAEARRWIGETLGGWNLSRAAQDAKQIASELVTNAVRHAPDGASVTLLAMYAADTLRLEVRDHDLLRLPLIKRPGELDTDGRGLVIVQALSTRWGIRITEAGKSVWSELDLPHSGPSLHSGKSPSKRRDGHHG